MGTGNIVTSFWFQFIATSTQLCMLELLPMPTIQSYKEWVSWMNVSINASIKKQLNYDNSIYKLNALMYTSMYMKCFDETKQSLNLFKLSCLFRDGAKYHFGYAMAHPKQLFR